ncbi:histidine phosphatase family protein [Caldimonas tepidiphila]|uniref:histidine phosphatase family protein n=1 Tax=Caldimonas tepidiphila TaxID=2315841 RepID=UPI001F0BC7E8|nr:histidine phosphatase family protein [Caldimonas tepidiphila]
MAEAKQARPAAGAGASGGTPAGGTEFWIWRHPRAEGAAGRCIGRTDLAVDRRRAKRLAHRIRRAARRHGLPREVWTSPLRRCREVGLWLRRWGWTLYVDESLAEMDFGAWDGRAWATIGAADFAGWDADFLHHAVGGGESLARLLARVEGFVVAAPPGPRLVIGHGGWINALRWLTGADHAAGRTPQANRWPAPPAHARLTRLDGPTSGATRS